MPTILWMTAVALGFDSIDVIVTDGLKSPGCVPASLVLDALKNQKVKALRNCDVFEWDVQRRSVRFE